MDLVWHTGGMEVRVNLIHFKNEALTHLVIINVTRSLQVLFTKVQLAWI